MHLHGGGGSAGASLHRDRGVCARVRLQARGAARGAGAGRGGTGIGVGSHRGRRRRARGSRRRQQLARLRAHLRRAALQPARPGEHRHREASRARVVPRAARRRHPERHAARGRRRHVLHRQLQQDARGRREDRQAALGVRPEGDRARGRAAARDVGLEPRARLLEGQGRDRHDRRPADRARREDRLAESGRRRPPTRPSRSTSPARRRCSATR